jgi:hypothetical protein
LAAHANGKELARDLAFVAGTKALIGAYVVARGVRYVSDDDFARVVIAEQFAHAPSLDPSGTSWLPLPFWMYGAVMAALGRNLDVARGVAFVLGVAGATIVFAALRTAGVPRAAAWIGTVVAMVSPWNAWLGVCTVPEAPTAALIVVGALAAARGASPRARIAGAVALLCAALSRYEAWPACAVFAGFAAFDARAPSAERRSALFAAGLAVLGPLAWMAWNAGTHGDALHFLARVAAYKRAHPSAGETTVAERLLVYPLALGRAAPGIVAVAAAAAWGARGDAAIRARYGRAFAVAAAVLAFLECGEIADGAPTHHPERALVALVALLAAFGADAGLVALGRARPTHVPEAKLRLAALLVVPALAAAHLVASAEAGPAANPDERREEPIARGRALRAEHAPALVVRPCAYEHFAFIAAFGAPELVTVETGPQRCAGECPCVERATQK